MLGKAISIGSAPDSVAEPASESESDCGASLRLLTGKLGGWRNVAIGSGARTEEQISDMAGILATEEVCVVKAGVKQVLITSGRGNPAGGEGGR